MSSFIYRVSKKRLENLLSHWKQHGITPRVKKSGGRNVMNKRLYTFEDMGRTKDFIQHYADTHGLLLPGRTPGFRKDGVILMPSCETKVKIYNAYKEACSQEGLC